MQKFLLKNKTPESKSLLVRTAAPTYAELVNDNVEPGPYRTWFNMSGAAHEGETTPTVPYLDMKTIEGDFVVELDGQVIPMYANNKNLLEKGELPFATIEGADSVGGSILVTNAFVDVDTQTQHCASSDMFFRLSLRTHAGPPPYNYGIDYNWNGDGAFWSMSFANRENNFGTTKPAKIFAGPFDGLMGVLHGPEDALKVELFVILDDLWHEVQLTNVGPITDAWIFKDASDNPYLATTNSTSTFTVYPLFYMNSGFSNWGKSASIVLPDQVIQGVTSIGYMEEVDEAKHLVVTGVTGSGSEAELRMTHLTLTVNTDEFIWEFGEIVDVPLTGSIVSPGVRGLSGTGCSLLTDREGMVVFIEDQNFKQSLHHVVFDTDITSASSTELVAPNEEELCGGIGYLGTGTNTYSYCFGAYKRSEEAGSMGTMSLVALNEGKLVTVGRVGTFTGSSLDFKGMVGQESGWIACHGLRSEVESETITFRVHSHELREQFVPAITVDQRSSAIRGIVRIVNKNMMQGAQVTIYGINDKPVQPLKDTDVNYVTGSNKKAFSFILAPGREIITTPMSTAVGLLDVTIGEGTPTITTNGTILANNWEEAKLVIEDQDLLVDELELWVAPVEGNVNG